MGRGGFVPDRSRFDLSTGSQRKTVQDGKQSSGDWGESETDEGGGGAGHFRVSRRCTLGSRRQYYCLV